MSRPPRAEVRRVFKGLSRMLEKRGLLPDVLDDGRILVDLDGRKGTERALLQAWVKCATAVELVRGQRVTQMPNGLGEDLAAAFEQTVSAARKLQRHC